MSETTISQRFNAADADLTILSADNVVFKVHQNNLKVHSEVFANMVNTATKAPEEAVHLSETSDVLEILFQYMYCQPQPELDGVAFDVSTQIAEAAEKYLVYSALPALRQKMSKHIRVDEHALEVLSFALRHDLKALANEAVPKSLGFPLKDALAVMSPESFIKWALFHDKWHTKAREQLTLSIHTSLLLDTQVLKDLTKQPSTGYVLRNTGHLSVGGPVWDKCLKFLDLKMYPNPED
ncbi:hypothetical protein C8F01DRAFT_1045859 [Mycena amicta]|nr:hypothetical protein C8F01DRAFT_1045859 [Mycena amicta]